MTDAQPYTIDNIRPDMVYGTDGRATEGYRVEFHTASGLYSYVRVPRSETLDADVHRAVASETEKLAAIMSMVPGTTPPKRGG